MCDGLGRKQGGKGGYSPKVGGPIPPNIQKEYLATAIISDYLSTYKVNMYNDSEKARNEQKKWT